MRTTISSCKPLKVALALAALVTLAVALVARGNADGIRLETRVLGQNQWLAGGTASVRVIALDHMSQSPVSGAVVDIAATRKDSKDAIKLAHGQTDSYGSLDAAFTVPAQEGEYALKVTVQGLGETDRLESSVTVKREYRVLLTTDKPLYQPGQVIHMRALVLSVPKLLPVTGQKLTLEVEDSKGNKVFKKSSDLSKFGLASADFQLATEINQGNYKIRALLDDDRVEKTVRVERYVLPKFKVTLETDKKYYLPGETVRGTVHADYFFGKPVDGKVIVKLARFDVAFDDFGEINGRTNDAGVFKFEQKLPEFFAGQPLEQGNAFFKAEVSVTDGADHTEKITSMVPVAKDPLKIQVIPEGGQLVPKLPNTIYVVVSYPDGTPAKATVLPFKRKGDERKTNNYGIVELRGETPESIPMDVDIYAEDDKGNSASVKTTLGGTQQDESLLLRLDKAIASVGERLNVSVLSSKESGNVYVDVIKEGQTMLTAALRFRNGRGEMALPLSANLSGTLHIHAYRISRTGNIVRDTRTVYVNPATDLKIAVSADKKNYLPGEPAKITFDVTDRKGKGLAAALGVSIVDESVFALQEMQPGLERIYFMLEKELAEPKFEIHGITPRDIVESPKPLDAKGLDQNKQLAAKALFAAVRKDQLDSSQPKAFTLQIDSYAQKIAKARKELAKRTTADYQLIAEAIRKFYDGAHSATLEQLGGVHYLAREGALNRSALTDQWGRPYEFSHSKWSEYRYDLIVHSYGPDRRKGTVDDIVVYGSPESGRGAGDDSFLVYEGTDFDAATVAGLGGRSQWMFFADNMAAPVRRAGADVGREVLALAARPASAFEVAEIKSKEAGGGPASSPAPEVRIRKYFPETLFFNPAVITDDHGRATIDVDMADSITTWRLTAMASSQGGALGSTTSPLRVFQDFFIDIDLPVALTQNDEVSIPIAVYNYLPGSQKVKLKLNVGPWFELDGAPEKTLDIGSGDVRAVYYRIKVKQLGWHKLTVHAYGSKMNDAISREIEVLPDGQPVEDSLNDRLEKTVKRTINIPADALDGASNIIVKVYPGFFSQLLEGMDRILQMPFGCFEQTSSTTYPNILALQYMKDTNQSTPEIQMKAEQYINLGYQRLLSFEVKGGGFSWFGDAPANKILTAWGLMEFADMAKVYEVDPNLITRTRDWLVSQQEDDGSWKPDKNYLHEESWGRIQHNEILPTAYITWAVAESGSYNVKGIDYLKKNWDDADDAYTLAIVVNAFYAAMNLKDMEPIPEAVKALDKLVGMAKEEDGKVHWESKTTTITFTGGKGADLEATALATLALIKSGRHSGVVNKALTYIVSSKDPNGTWYSTQATILCLKALIASMKNRTQDIDAKVTVLINGKEAGQFDINRENSDVMRQVDGKELVKEGENTIEIRFEGKGSSLYQISSKYYLPWDKLPSDIKKIMSIDVKYDRTQLEKDEMITSRVKIAFNGRGAANMVIVDLGTPPGFDVLAEDFEKLTEDKTIQKYTLTNRQVIVYLDKVDSDKPVEFSYRMKARFPLRAKTPRSVVYQYYNPEVRDVAAPVDIVVK